MAKGGKGSPNEQLQSPMFLYSALTKEKCDGGIALPTALQFMKSIGSVPWHMLEYNTQSCPSWEPLLNAASNKSFRSYRLTDKLDDVVTEIRTNIVAGNPVITAINACKEFDNPTNGRISRISNSEIGCQGHAVLVVGYDERIPALKILNSWGENWGEKGYVWMDYSVFKKRYWEAYVDFGPGESVDDIAFIEQLSSKSISKPPPSIATVTSDILVKGLRSNIDPRTLTHVWYQGQRMAVSKWALWLNLPQEYASQIKSVAYSFHHSTFRNPKISQKGSSVFLAQWDGWGCAGSASLRAELKTGKIIEADFNHCEVTDSPAESMLSSR